MTVGELVLVILPPAGAIFAQKFGGLSLEFLSDDARKTIHEETALDSTLPHYDLVLEFISGTASGAIAAIGLIPTFVSVLTSGFGIIYGLQSAFWPTLVYVISIFLISFYVFRILWGKTLYSIARGGKLSYRIMSIQIFRGTRAEAVSYVVYAANIVLIALAFFVFYYQSEVKTSLCTPAIISQSSPAIRADHPTTPSAPHPASTAPDSQ